MVVRRVNQAALASRQRRALPEEQNVAVVQHVVEQVAGDRVVTGGEHLDYSVTLFVGDRVLAQLVKDSVQVDHLNLPRQRREVLVHDGRRIAHGEAGRTQAHGYTRLTCTEA
eukprot:7390223-Prymnesium_polylepis.2